MGSDKYEGKLIWAPIATWRRPFQPNASSTSLISTTLAALDGESVGFPFGKMRNRECYPMLSQRDLALLFEAKSPPPEPPKHVLDQISDIEVSVSHITLTASKPPKAKGGAPTQHDWDGFWIEVVCWAAENDLNQQDRPKLKKLVLDWFAQNSETPPDATTVDKKLSALFSRSMALLARKRRAT
jgi:hypothetical protein